MYGDPHSELTELSPCWVKRPIHQARRGNTSIIKVGRPHDSPIQLPPYKNPIKRALAFQGLFDDGIVDSKTKLAKLLGLSRSRVSIVLNLLNLDEEIKSYLLELDDDDPKLKVLNERKLRPLAKMGRRKQRKVFAESVQMPV